MFTIDNDITNEIIIKNSKFICIIHKIYNIDDIDLYLKTVKDLYKDATHYCYAYIINDIKKFNDDGEPSGTAGSPIIQVLEKNSLNYVICIVIRYFGGIKLGAGGLIRAYSKSVVECLKLSNIKELIKGYNVDIIFNYNYINTVNYLLKECNILNKEFNDNITYNLNIDNNLYNQLKNDSNIKVIINKEIKIEKDG